MIDINISYNFSLVFSQIQAYLNSLPCITYYSYVLSGLISYRFDTRSCVYCDRIIVFYCCRLKHFVLYDIPYYQIVALQVDHIIYVYIRHQCRLHDSISASVVPDYNILHIKTCTVRCIAGTYNYRL